MDRKCEQLLTNRVRVMYSSYSTGVGAKRYGAPANAAFGGVGGAPAYPDNKRPRYGAPGAGAVEVGSPLIYYAVDLLQLA